MDNLRTFCDNLLSSFDNVHPLLRLSHPHPACLQQPSRSYQWTRHYTGLQEISQSFHMYLKYMQFWTAFFSCLMPLNTASLCQTPSYRQACMYDSQTAPNPKAREGGNYLTPAANPPHFSS